MKAAVLKAFGAPLSIEEVDDPRPGPDDAVIRVMACGIDGTDLKLLDGFGYTPDLPFIMGHEPAGLVESVGDRVTALRLGDRVIPYNFLIPSESSWYTSDRVTVCTENAVVIVIDGYVYIIN